MPPSSRCTLLMLCFIACFICGDARGQTAPPVRTLRNMHIARVSTPPVLDDYINGAAPGGVAPITDFIQRNPDDGKPASSETKAWLAYDNENLYVIFVCRSPAGELRARYTKRDDIFADDFVGILLDTFNRFKIFALAEVGAKGDHFTAVLLLEPAQDHRSVQSAGIGKNHFFDVHRVTKFWIFSLTALCRMKLSSALGNSSRH